MKNEAVVHDTTIVKPMSSMPFVTTVTRGGARGVCDQAGGFYGFI